MTIETVKVDDVKNLFEKYVAERVQVRFGLMSKPLEMLQRANVRVESEDYGDRLAFALETWIHAMPGKRIREYKEWPKDWWQAFRERWFPVWWLRRYPVKTDFIEIDIQQYLAVCPHIQDDEQKEHLDWLAYEFEKGREFEK